MLTRCAPLSPIGTAMHAFLTSKLLAVYSPRFCHMSWVGNSVLAGELGHTSLQIYWPSCGSIAVGFCIHRSWLCLILHTLVTGPDSMDEDAATAIKDAAPAIEDAATAIEDAATAIEDAAPIMVLDELDSGIGARLGTVTGRLLQRMAATSVSQLLCITHLPQVDHCPC